MFLISEISSISISAFKRENDVCRNLDKHDIKGSFVVRKQPSLFFFFSNMVLITVYDIKGYFV
jgi:hypothetical protein